MAMNTGYAPSNNFGQIEAATNPYQKRMTGTEQPNDIKPNMPGSGFNYQTNSYAGPSNIGGTNEGTAVASAASGGQVGAGTGGGTYAPLQGFDFTKLSTGGGTAGKYTDAVRTFSQGIGSGLQIGRNDLGAMVEYAKKYGHANAQAVGDDKIDFGDGNGPIDVIQSNGSLWFQNGGDRFGPTAGATGGGAMAGGPAYAGTNERRMQAQNRRPQTSLTAPGSVYGPNDQNMDISQFLGGGMMNSLRM